MIRTFLPQTVRYVWEQEIKEREEASMVGNCNIGEESSMVLWC